LAHLARCFCVAGIWTLCLASSAVAWTVTEIIDATGDGVGNTLSFPHGVAVDGSGNVYVADPNSRNVFQITPGGTITEILDATGGGAGDFLCQPNCVAANASDDVCVTGGLSDLVSLYKPI
jgi:hypothetical protein